jgi:hypothetical protein
MSNMPSAEHPSKKNTLIRYTAGIFSFVINYMAYGFLTPVVLLTLAAIVFSYTAITGPELPFLRSFDSMMPANSGKLIKLDGDDIMHGFYIVTTALFVLSLIGSQGKRFLISRKNRRSLDSEELSGKNETLPNRAKFSLSINKRRLLITSIMLTAIFTVSIIMIPFASLAEGESRVTWYVIFAILWVIVLIFNGIYVVIRSLSDKLYEWAKSQAG